MIFNAIMTAEWVETRKYLMALRQLTYLGNPVLRTPAQPCTDFATPELLRLTADMAETMQAHRGVGLAAPQIGLSQRVIVFWLPDMRAEQENSAEAVPLQILINPEISALTTDLEEGLEGCLSLPGLRGMVPRLTAIGYRGFDPMGHQVEREAHGFLARIIQHEVDHLDGIMYLDRMTDFSSLTHESEIRRRLQREAEEKAHAEINPTREIASEIATEEEK